MKICGTVLYVKDFLSKRAYSVKMNSVKLELFENRKYFIPSYQREIRWSEENVNRLILDLHNSDIFLGNIVLSKRVDSHFDIIDGQQRTTTIIMIIQAIECIYGESFVNLDLCDLEMENFKGFQAFAKDFYDHNKGCNSYLDTDLFKQAKRYNSLWECIRNSEIINDQHKAYKLIENLKLSEINIIYNNDENNNRSSIRYFIDVNLKSVRLDVEDIFKSYLFKTDDEDIVKQIWVDLKQEYFKLEEINFNYPFTMAISHMYHCDLYKDHRHEGLVFGDDFIIDRNSKQKEHLMVGEHILDYLHDPDYNRRLLKKLTESFNLMNKIMSNEYFDEFKVYLGNAVSKYESKIIYNFIKKILKDKERMPKALVLKYFNEILLNNQSQMKDYGIIYEIYAFSILFTVFSDKKDYEEIKDILENKYDWSKLLVDRIIYYLSKRNLPEAKLKTNYSIAKRIRKNNYTKIEDDKFRAKSLATIYNFMKIENNRIKLCGNKQIIFEYLYSDLSCTVEHFLLNNSGNCEIQLENEICLYRYPDKYKSYKSMSST